MIFNRLEDIFIQLATVLQPPERLTVSQAAEKYRYVNSPGSYVGPWLNRTVAPMVEPMDVFTSTRFSGMVFVGPAQSGKTDSLVLNTVLYSIIIDPMDTMVVCPTMLAARDFSIRRIDRLHRHSTAVGAKLVTGANADNTYDKQYTTGMLLSLSWPTPTELAGKPIGRVILTDRDRMPDDVDGDGEPFDLASKRTTTFGSYAMTVAESSPSRPVENLKWIPSSLHEAPPCEGILKLYNRGDRRRWYWPCPSCSTYFEGKFEQMTWDNDRHGSNLEKAETVRLQCPHCSYKIHSDEREGMQQRGRWVKDGQGIDKEGNVYGPEPRTLIASFWLRGVAATFTSWKKLVAQYLDAYDEYERTLSEEALKKFYNNDLGEPYYPKSQDNARLPEVLRARAERLTERKVPQGVRFLIATCDVQKNMFVVQVFGVLPGKPFDLIIFDRFDVKYSKREDDDGQKHWVKPHTYLEDWDELTEHVIQKTYELDDDSGRRMGIRFTACDSGGKEGVTAKAYDFYRRLRQENLHRRFILVKGDTTPKQPRARLSTPDATRKDVNAVARGDVPVLFLNSNILKDDLNGRLDSVIPGTGMIRFADWFGDAFFNEMCSEFRGPKGWENPSGHRNEAWDLTYYCIGLCISELIRAEHLDWANPQPWFAPWDENNFVSLPEQDPSIVAPREVEYDFAKLGKSLA